MVYSILANASAAEPTKLEVILEGFVGLFVVLFILSLLTLVLLALSKMTFLREKPPAAKLAPAAVPVPVAAGAAAALNPNDPHTKVVLAAAAHVARHLPVIAAAAAIEVLGTTSSLQLNPPDTSWAGAGRQAIFASHATRG